MMGCFSTSGHGITGLRKIAGIVLAGLLLAPAATASAEPFQWIRIGDADGNWRGFLTVVFDPRSTRSPP
tara:strand:- start:772 stop:978 length:207 start_codon:yes stop_codon:yes gene_type:complete